MVPRAPCFRAVLPMILLSTACGGSDGGSNQAPPAAVVTPPATPAPSPAPAPTPTPNASALLTPTLTGSPTAPLADVGGRSFAAPGNGASFPLLLTAITSPFAGDALTTERGGTIDQTSDGSLRLTLNNSALGVSGVPLATNTKIGIPGGSFQSFAEPSAGDRLYVRNSVWIISMSGGKNGGVSSVGFVPPPGSIPTSGRLSYTGSIGGLISEYHIAGGDGVALLSGDVQFDADFGSATVTGKITGLRVGSDGFYVPGAVNELTFTATLDAATNIYRGEVLSGSSPGGPNAFQSGALGTIVGRFYGPDAGEAGAVLILSDGTSRLLISFSAKR